VEIIAWVAENEMKHEGCFKIACGPCGRVCREAEVLQFQGSLTGIFPGSVCLAEYDLKSYIGVPVKRGDGTVIGILCAMDYRERVFSEDDIRLLEIFARYVGHEIEHDVMEQELQLSQRMKVLGQLASGVAHEVRNPLNAILAISEALSLDLGESPEHSEYIEQIRTQVKRLSKLMQDLLDLGKPILETSMQKESLVGICSSALDIWTGSASHEGRRVRFEKPEKDDGLFVLGDSSRLQQVLVNLLENAAQHSPDGGEISLAVSGPVRDMLTVRVTDPGEGMKPENLDKVFEPFYTTRKGGTGLGLSIVRHIVETHGGRVSIENNDPPPGCTVTIALPAVEG
jgi:signal transduction histidine kinase